MSNTPPCQRSYRGINPGHYHASAATAARQVAAERHLCLKAVSKLCLIFRAFAY